MLVFLALSTVGDDSVGNLEYQFWNLPCYLLGENVRATPTTLTAAIAQNTCGPQCMSSQPHAAFPASPVIAVTSAIAPKDTVLPRTRYWIDALLLRLPLIGSLLILAATAQFGRTLEVRAKDWGIHIDSVRLLDIEMPEDLKRMMSRQASAEREKRATITKAEGDKLAAANLSEAARLMAATPGAMQLRTLQTIDGLGPTPSNTVLLYPVELVQALTDFSRVFKKNTPEGGKDGSA